MAQGVRGRLIPAVILKRLMMFPRAPGFPPALDFRGTGQRRAVARAKRSGNALKAWRVGKPASFLLADGMAPLRARPARRSHPRTPAHHRQARRGMRQNIKTSLYRH